MHGASIAELAQIMASCQRLVSVHVLFWKPKRKPGDWAKTDLWDTAESIPGVMVHVDENGVEARAFGAHTSGHIVLYDSGGNQLFHGGITGARGHVGDNTGESTVIALLTGGIANVAESPVYGCPLFDADAGCEEGDLSCTK